MGFLLTRTCIIVVFVLLLCVISISPMYSQGPVADSQSPGSVTQKATVTPQPNNDLISDLNSGSTNQSNPVEQIAPDLFTGDLPFSLPLEILPGRRGVEPNLSLVYRPGATSTIIGPNWDFEVGRIDYVVPKIFDVPKASFVFVSGSTRSPLVEVNPDLFREYLSRDGRLFKKIRSSDGEIAWYMLLPNGLRYAFGTTKDSRVFDASSQVSTVSWHLDSVTDPLLNTLSVKYWRDAGQLYPTVIQYTGQENVPGLETIEFRYSLRDEPDLSYAWGFSVKTCYQLKEVEMKHSGRTSHAYQFDYLNPLRGEIKSWGHLTLSSVHRTGADHVSRTTVVSFKYDVDLQPAPSLLLPVGLADSEGGTELPSYLTAFYPDLNGDARIDVCTRTTKGLRCWLQDGLGHLMPVSTTLWTQRPDLTTADLLITLFGDIDGDGRDDVCGSNGVEMECYLFRIDSDNSGKFVGPVKVWSKKTLDVLELRQDATLRLVDIDSDGDADLCHTREGTLRCFINNTCSRMDGRACQLGKDPFSQELVGPVWLDGGRRDRTHIARYADLNGDGLLDFCWRQDSGMSCSLLSETNGILSFGPHFDGPPLSDDKGWRDRTKYGTIVAVDVNSDGRTDLCARTEDGIRCWLSTAGPTGVSFIRTPVLVADLSDSSGWNSSPRSQSINFTYVNGDAYPDLCARSSDGFHCWMGPSFTRVWAGPLLADADGWLDRTKYSTLQWIDIDADGQKDLCGRTVDGLRCWRTRFSPERLTDITTELGGSFQIHYQPSASGGNHLPVPHLVVDRVRAIAGSMKAGGAMPISEMSYAYQNGIYDTVRHSFRGFGHVSRSGPFDASGMGIVRETWFHQGQGQSLGTWNNQLAVETFEEQPVGAESDALQGAILKRLNRTAAGGVEEWELFGYGDVDPFPESFQIMQTQRDAGRCWGGGECQLSRERSNYDEYGNEISFDRLGDPAVTGDEVFTSRQYQTQSNPYFVSLLVNESIHDQGQTGKRRVTEQWFYYDEPPTEAVTTACGASSDVATDAAGLLTRTVKWLGTNISEGGEKQELTAESRFINNRQGMRRCEISPNGGVKKWSYDNSGIRRTRQTDALGHVTVFAYTGDSSDAANVDPPGLLQMTTEPKGVKTTYIYDSLGRLVLRRAEGLSDQNTGIRQSWEYDDIGNPSRQRIVERTGPLIGKELSTHSRILDGFGRIVRDETSGPAGHTIVTEHTFGARGLQTSKTYPFLDGEARALLQYSYDALGRLSGVTFPDTTTIRRCWLGKEIFLTEQTGRRTSFTIDAYGHVVEIRRFIESGPQCTWNTSKAYSRIALKLDSKNRTVEVTAPDGSAAGSEFDGGDHATSKTDFGGITEDDVFDASGNLVLSRSPGNTTVHYEYDKGGRLTKKSDNPKWGVRGINAQYAYDDPGHLGLLASSTNGNLTARVLYDGLSNRVGSAVSTHGWVGEHQAMLDALKRPISITYQKSFILDYEYDGPFVRSVRVRNEKVPLAIFSNYDASGNPRNIVYGNGVTSTFAYEYGSGRLQESRALLQSGAKIFQRHYEYDPGGNVLKIKDGDVTLESFGYDPLERLTSAVGPYGSLEWEYDEMDRMKKMGRDNVVVVYDKSKPYEIHKMGGAGVTYDSSGRLRKGPVGEQNRQVSMRYDSEGHLVDIRRGFQNVTIKRGADGQAVAKSHKRFRPWLRALGVGAGLGVEGAFTGGAGVVGPLILSAIVDHFDRTTERQVGDMLECIGRECALYVYAGANPIGALIVSKSEGSLSWNVKEKYFYHSDVVGSVRNITNQKSDVVLSREFDPYGGALQCSRVWKGGLGLNVAFAGGREECRYGLIEFGDRHYAPKLAMFTSRDREDRKWPDPRWLNNYAYGFWSPLKYRDTSGRQPQGRSDDDWSGSGYERYSDSRTSFTSWSTGGLNAPPAGQTLLQLGEQGYAEMVIQYMWVGLQLKFAERDQASISQRVALLKEDIARLDPKADRLASTVEVTTQILDAWRARPSGYMDPLFYGPLLRDLGRAPSHLSDIMLFADGALLVGATRPVSDFVETSWAAIEAHEAILQEQEALNNINGRIQELKDRQEKLIEAGRFWRPVLEKAGSQMVGHP